MKNNNTFIQKLKKGTALGSLVLLLLQQGTVNAFAQVNNQTASSSGQMTVGSSSAQLLPQDPSQQAAFLGVNQLATSPTPESASIAQPTVVSKLPKNSYKAEEQVEFTVGNSSKDGVRVAIIDENGNDTTNTFIIQKFTSGTNTIVDVVPPQSRFKPGKYTLKITDSTGNSTTQDFTWGVLAINTNKSIYLPNETAQIALAVLDESGNMVCDADVTLKITDPQNTVQTLTTASGDIVVNDICTKHEFSLTPDYQTTYTVGTAGTYTMDLSATTKNGTYNISDSFEVASSVDFDVQRVSATRLYPPLDYPVTLNITAHKDFSGIITDYVPATFDITPATDSATRSYTDIKTVYPGSENTKDLFGLQSLKLSLPFTGSHTVEQGFGEQLTDPKEKAEYATYHVLGHDGIDFAMPIGTAVLAADDGVVVRAALNDDYGTTMVVRHSWGQSYYGHLSKMEVHVGDTVKRGQEIAKSGNTGLSSGSHLHFGIKPKNPQMENGFFGKVDPAPYLPLSQSDASSWDINTRFGNQPLKVIEWKVNLKEGQTVSLGYQFKAPRVSPQFYTLGPLHFIDSEGNVVFSEARLWQLAADAVLSSPVYLSNTAASIGLSTTSWQLVTSAPASGNTTTTAKQTKTAGYIQFKPGAANTTFGALPTGPDGTGWVYTTPLDSTIPTGTWTFNVTTTTSAASGTGHVVVCAWVVHVSGTSLVKDSAIFPSSADCTEGSTNIMTQTTALNSNVSVASVPAVSFSSSQYLYVEYWLRMTVAGSTNNATTTFIVNAGSAQDISWTGGSSSNLSPNAPTQNTPANTQTNVSTTPTFTLSTTDPESDSLQYKVTIYNQSGCSAGVVQTNDQSSSQTGWSGQNATCSVSNDCYTSGTTATYTAQSSLTGLTQYWWRASAKDPLGANAFINSSTCNSFTTAAPPPTLDQLLRHGQYFYGGLSQPFTF